MRRFFILSFLVLPLCLLPGCQSLIGYQMGTSSLFRPDIQTVYVPMVESDPTRRHLAEKLTEAICKRIEERSPYKVVGRASADSVLECRISDKSQQISIVDSYNDPRQKSGELSLDVRWQDRRTQELRQFDALSWDHQATRFTASDVMVAEYGHSQLTSEQKQIDQIADRIVEMMELPW